MEALIAVAQLVRQGGAMIGIGGGLLDVEPELELIHVGGVEMISVAAPTHSGAPLECGVVGNFGHVVVATHGLAAPAWQFGFSPAPRCIGQAG